MKIISPRELLLTGMPGYGYGVKFLRKITLYPDSAVVKIDNTIANVTAHDVVLGIWNITWVAGDWRVAFPLEQGSRFPDGIHFFHPNEEIFKLERHANWAEFIFAWKSAEKQPYVYLGTDKGDWIAAVKGEQVFVKKSAKFPGKAYGNEDFALEFYCSPRLMELEMLTPSANRIPPGGTFSVAHYWNLGRVSQKEVSGQPLFERIGGLLSEMDGVVQKKK